MAPRAQLQEVGHGEAQLVNAESTAYILADAWFCLIAAIGGVVTGIAGYRFLVRRAGWTAMAGLLLGTVGAAMAAGALLGWAFGSWGIGLLVGAVAGIPLAVLVVYLVYSKQEQRA